MPVRDALVFALGRNPHPLEEIAGVPYALRATLTLQKMGVERVFLVVRPGDEASFPWVLEDSRVKIPVFAVRSTAPSDVGLCDEAWTKIRASTSGPLIVIQHNWVMDVAPLRALESASESLDAEARAAFTTRAGAPLGPWLLTKTGALELSDGWDQESAFQTWSAEKQVQFVDCPTGLFIPVTSDAERRAATEALFEACRKPMDGLVAKNLNRHISIFISKRLIRTRITPNQMSAFTLLLGFMGAWFVSRGGYGNVLFGAFLFQWNSILDGVDGELARVRFQHSTFGQWFDTISDDLSNVLFYGGLAWGALHTQGLLLPPTVLFWCGVVAVGAHLLATAQFYAEMYRLGSGDLYAIEWGFDKTPPPGIAGALIGFFRLALKKDFAILFFFALALLNVLPYALPIIAGGAIGNFIAATIRNIKKFTKKPALGVS